MNMCMVCMHYDSSHRSHEWNCWRTLYAMTHPPAAECARHGCPLSSIGAQHGL